MSPVALAVSQSVAQSVTGTGGWTPRSLYRNGRVGPLYEPGPLTCYSDFLGTPAGVGDSVALQLDTSQDRLRMGPQLSTGAADLNVAANWTASGTNTVAQDGDEVVITYVDDANGALLDISGLTDYGLYRLTGTLTATGAFNFGTTNNRTSLAVQGCTAGANEIEVFFVSDGSTRFAFTGFSSGNVARLSGMSLRQVLGYHAYQDTTAARPLLGRWPVTGKRNLLTSTEDLSAAAWTKFNTTIGTSITTADGVVLDEVVETTDNSFHIASQVQDLASGAITGSARLQRKGTSRRYAAVRVLAYDAGGNIGRYAVLVDLNDGSVVDTDTSGSAAVTAGATNSVTDFGDGTFRVSGTVTHDATTSATCSTSVALSDTATPSWSGSSNINYAGDTNESIYAGGFQIEFGSLTAYQRVGATDIDITEAGVQSAYFLRGDGVDDYLATTVPEVTSGHTLALVGTQGGGSAQSYLSVADSSVADEYILAMGEDGTAGPAAATVEDTGATTIGGAATNGVIGLVSRFGASSFDLLDAEGNADSDTDSLPAGMTALRLHGIGDSSPSVVAGDIYFAASIDASITDAERTALLDYMRAETPA